MIRKLKSKGNRDMNKKPYLSLQHSESVVIAAAANIYAAYIISNHVGKEEQEAWMERSIKEALWIAAKTDEIVHSDEEMS